MNSIINKLPLPYDIQYEIYNFCYNEYGFTKEQIEKIHLSKEKQKGRRLRVLYELIYWKRTNTAVCWLKGYGAYNSIHIELNILKELLLLNVLSKKNYILILESIKEDIPTLYNHYEKIKYFIPNISRFHVHLVNPSSNFHDFIINKIDQHIEMID